MLALYKLIAALSLPVTIFSWLGGITAGIWLAILGEWKVIGAGLLMTFLSHILLAFIIMPGLIFAAPALKAIESGRTILGAIVGSLTVIYTMVVVVVSSYLMLCYFYDRIHDSSPIPFLLWSYGAATGPWTILASKDQQGQDGGNQHSLFAVFFLSYGYICCILALTVWSASLTSCFWILAAFMSVSGVVSAADAFREMRERARYGR